MESRALISRTNRLSQRGVTNEQAQIVEQEISCEVQDHVRSVGSGGGGQGTITPITSWQGAKMGLLYYLSF